MDQYSSSLTKGDDIFMKTFKYYKCNKPKPDLTKLISTDSSTDQITPIKPIKIVNDERTDTLGLKEVKHWQLHSFPNNPGLFLIRNPFTPLGQRYWIRKCLEDYPRKPNKLNIDNEMDSKDWWAECFENGKCNSQLLKKLRWTTLGYHHNWDTKIYTEDNRNDFPDDLAELSDVIAKYLGYGNFRAEAAIVNYYHMNSTLSAHTDHSEVNLEAPLFSFSFGQSAIFLLGGNEKSIDPLPLLLQSGDIVIMSKEARLCYHAVPKILPSKTTPWNDERHLIPNIDNINLNFKYLINPKQIINEINENAEDMQWRKFQNYVSEARINMNVRQVLNETQTCLTD